MSSEVVNPMSSVDAAALIPQGTVPGTIPLYSKKPDAPSFVAGDPQVPGDLQVDSEGLIPRVDRVGGDVVELLGQAKAIKGQTDANGEGIKGVAEQIGELDRKVEEIKAENGILERTLEQVTTGRGEISALTDQLKKVEGKYAECATAMFKLANGMNQRGEAEAVQRTVVNVDLVRNQVVAASVDARSTEVLGHFEALNGDLENAIAVTSNLKSAFALVAKWGESQLALVRSILAVSLDDLMVINGLETLDDIRYLAKLPDGSIKQLQGVEKEVAAVVRGLEPSSLKAILGKTVEELTALIKDIGKMGEGTFQEVAQGDKAYYADLKAMDHSILTKMKQCDKDVLIKLNEIPQGVFDLLHQLPLNVIYQFLKLQKGSGAASGENFYKPIQQMEPNLLKGVKRLCDLLKPEGAQDVEGFVLNSFDRNRIVQAILDDDLTLIKGKKEELGRRKTELDIDEEQQRKKLKTFVDQESKVEDLRKYGKFWNSSMAHYLGIGEDQVIEIEHAHQNADRKSKEYLAQLQQLHTSCGNLLRELDSQIQSLEKELDPPKGFFDFLSPVKKKPPEDDA